MKLNYAVCDDDGKALEVLSQAVSRWANENGHIPCGHTFSSGEAFLFAYEEQRTYDLLLLDVEMQALSGIDLAKKLRRDGFGGEIVFVTSHFEFAGEGYEVDALHYLTKPLSMEKLYTVLEKAVARISAEPPSVTVNVTGEGSTVKLYTSEILYAESFRHDLVIHTEKGDYTTKEGIAAFEARAGEGFYRIHRSYLVSLPKVVRISRTEVTLKDGTKLPLARGKYDDVNRAFIACM